MKNRDDITVLCGTCITAVFGEREVEALTIGLVLGACSRCGAKLTATDKLGHFRKSVVEAAEAAKAPEIPLTAVSSSNVEAVGYDAPTRTARVRFKGGQTYRYTDVPPELHESIMKAPSVGQAVRQLRTFSCTREPGT